VTLDLSLPLRANDRLAEANAKLLGERHRSKSLIASSMANGSLGGPPLDLGSLGSLPAYGASLGGLGLGPGGSPLGGRQGSRVEDYLAKVSSAGAAVFLGWLFLSSFAGYY
jgi:hypothetical protein